jgi:sterol desaturase/sphingolipid hydroxylase (fatty acid hydroxylase superfamily)
MAGLELLAAVVVVLFLAEKLWPASATQRGEWLHNGGAFGLTIVGQVVAHSVLPMMETRLVNLAGGGLVDLGALPFAAGAIIYVLAMDLGEYAFHRAQHAFPWLWAMHSLHHSDRALNVGTTQRHYWLDPCIKAVTIWLAVSLLFKANGPILAVYGLLTLYHFVAHANLRLGFGPLSWVLNAPQYHRIHHSRDPAHFNTNFASLFPIFDLISGAYRRPAAGEFPETGLDEHVASPLDLITWPLRWFSPAGTAPSAPAPAPAPDVVHGRRM